MPAQSASASCETPLRSRWQRTTSPKVWLSESSTPVKSGFADEMSTDGRRQTRFRKLPREVSEQRCDLPFPTVRTARNCPKDEPHLADQPNSVDRVNLVVGLYLARRLRAPKKFAPGFRPRKSRQL